MFPKDKEQRKHERVNSALVTELHDGSETSRGKGCILDLGMGGMGFETEAEFEEGTDVYLTFSLPFRIRGKIVHAQKSRILKKYGVKFTDIGDFETKRLKKYISARIVK